MKRGYVFFIVLFVLSLAFVAGAQTLDCSGRPGGSGGGCGGGCGQPCDGLVTVVSDDACVVTDDNTNWTAASEVNFLGWQLGGVPIAQDLKDNYDASYIWACPFPINNLAYFGPYRFTKVFYLPPSGSYKGWIKAAADNCYLLYVNGHRLGGTCNVSPTSDDPLDYMSIYGGVQPDPYLWQQVGEYLLDETILHAGWNHIDCYGVNWLTYIRNGREATQNPGEGNPAGVIFAAQIHHDCYTSIKMTPQALNNTSSGKYVKLHIAKAPASWHTGWQNLLLNGEIAPLEAKSLGGAASAGALQVVYSRKAVEDWLTANVYNAGTWVGRYTFWVSYDGFYGQDNIKIMDPPRVK